MHSDHQRGEARKFILTSVHASVKVPVTGQHRAADEITGLDGGGDLQLEGPGVADAGGAPITHQAKADSASSSSRAALFVQSVTTREPGAKLVLTHG